MQMGAGDGDISSILKELDAAVADVSEAKRMKTEAEKIAARNAADMEARAAGKVNVFGARRARKSPQ